MDLAFRNVGLWECESVGAWGCGRNPVLESNTHDQFGGTIPAHVGRRAAVVTVDKVLLCFILLPFTSRHPAAARLMWGGVQLRRKLL